MALSLTSFISPPRSLSLFRGSRFAFRPQLDDAGTYFDLGPRVVGGKPGTYHYFSTRNNDFSNRGHKAMVTVDPAYAGYTVMSLSGDGGIVQVLSPSKAVAGVAVVAQPGALAANVQIEVNVFAADTQSEANGYANSVFVQVCIDFMLIRVSQRC